MNIEVVDDNFLTPEEMEQGTDDWLQARVGKVTASRIADVLAKTKSGYSASRKNYMSELLVERLTGNPTEHFVSKEMQWGTDTEPLARGEYENKKGVLVKQVGFIDHPTIEMCGGSPDGLVGDDGMVEIKCPNTAQHIATILGKAPDGRYYAQMQWNMWCAGRKWCDFVSYDPRMPIGLELFISRVKIDEDYLAETVAPEVRKFLAELDDMETKLREYGNAREA